MKHERIGGARSEEPRLFHCELDRDIPPGYKYGPVICDIYIVESCIEGGGSIIINNKEFSFAEGDCFVLLPGDSVAYIADPVTSRRCLWCAIDGLRIGELLKRAGISSVSPMIKGEFSAEVTEILRQMVAMREDTDAGADLRRTACIYSLLGVVLRNHSATNKNIWVQNAIGFIETNYHRQITVSDIAAEVGLERSYFSILFKDSTGMSPYAYLSSLRVHKACVLMKEGYSVAQAAELVGVDSQNFARIFRRIVGVTPRRYLEQVATKS